MTATVPTTALRAERNVLIALPDGTTLAGDLYLPAGGGPFPTLVSLYPYRKDDVIGAAFEHPRRRLVDAGYAHLLVDVRGYGGSAGVPVESMDPRPEGADAAAVVEWAAAQPWSTGDVGVWGVSYGALVSFAVAERAPAALKAIAAVYGLDDIGRDAIAPGGVPLCLGRYAREAVMLAQELAPPSHQDAAGRWADVWRARLERIGRRGPWSLAWPEHGPEEPYWRERTVALERIAVPTLLIAGWRDLFAEPMTRALARTPGARRLVAGPWMHVVPDLGPEPIDWLDELRRFFDVHVRGLDEDAEPDGATVFVQGDGGGWRHFASWPPPGAERLDLHPGRGGRLADAPGSGEDSYASVATVGVAAGLLDPLGAGVGLPGDQGPDDLRSLTYTTEPLAAALTIAGSPEAALGVAVEDGRPAELSVRLVDVHPDGGAKLITHGCARLEGSGRATVRLAATAYRLPAGHRLRLAVACADFPRRWPLPYHVRLRVRLAGSTLQLPALPTGAGGAEVEPPRPEPVADRAPWTVAGGPEWTVSRDEVTGTVSVTSGGAEELQTPSGAAFAIRHRATASVSDERPDGARIDAEARIEIRMPRGERVEVDVQARARRDRQHYAGRVLLDGQTVLDRSWGHA